MELMEVETRSTDIRNSIENLENKIEKNLLEEMSTNLLLNDQALSILNPQDIWSLLQLFNSSVLRECI